MVTPRKPRTRSPKKATIPTPDPIMDDSDYTTSAWQNFATGMGGANDRMSYQQISMQSTLKVNVIEALILADWCARRIALANPHEAFRTGLFIEYTGESDRDRDLVSAVQSESNRLRLCSKAREAASWGRAYGGGILLMVTDDGQAADPMDIAKVNKVYSLEVFDPNDVSPMMASTYDPYQIDASLQWPDHSYYQLISSYTQASSSKQIGVKIHPSRVATFGGALVSRSVRWKYFSGWDASVLQPVYDQLREFSSTRQSITRMLSSGSQQVLKMPNLWNLVSKGQKEKLRARLQASSLASWIGNILPINGDEDLSFVERSFAGIRDCGEYELLLVAGAAEMPATYLFGRAPAGMDATGESDTKAWHSSIMSWWYSTYEPAVRSVVRVIAASMGAEDLDNWGVCEPSLALLDDVQLADLDVKTTQADEARVRLGMPEEVILRHRYGANGYDRTPPLMTEEDLETLEDHEEAEDTPMGEDQGA